MNLGHTCLFHKGFCIVYFGAKEKNAATLPHSAQREHVYLGKIREISKTKKLLSRKNIDLEFLHQILGHRYTISFLVENTANVWEYIDLRIDPDPFCTSFQIYSMKKRLGLRIH